MKHMTRHRLASLIGSLLLLSMSLEFAAANPAISDAKEKLRKQLLAVETQVPDDACRPLKPLTDYARLTEKRTWSQRWDPVKRELADEPVKMTGTVWSAAVEQSMNQQNGVFIPEMREPVYLDRSIIVETGSRVIVHPKTEIRMIIDKVEHCLIRNKSLVSGQEGPVELCKGADRDILIEGGIWSDQKNNGAGPQGFREGKKGLMLGSQGCIVLSNVENVTIRGVTVRDYSSFGIQIGNAINFLVEDICVDGTKDGVHVEGPARYGIIRRIGGPLAGDDVVALNAWDWRTSSLTFGTISDILVRDTNVEKGSCAIRILPGIKVFPDGSTLECGVSRCIFSNIRNVHSFKIYDQPNIRCVKDDYSGDLGTVSSIFFENVHVRPLDLRRHHDKGKNGVFDLCECANGLFFENIYMDYVPGPPNPQYLLTVGPKSRIARIPFAASGTQETYNPNASPVAANIVIRHVFTRPEGDAGEYQRHENPEALVHCSSLPGGGTGTIIGPVTGEPGTAASKPNVVFIFADDWGWGDLSCHGHPHVKTPNIDRLSKEGTDFHRFSVASGVCSPSRTAVMTGHFPARYCIDGHFAWVPSNAKRGMPDWLSPKAPLLSRMLQNAGYATAHYGKWHLANDMIPDSPLPSEYGFDDYGAFNCAGEQMPYYEDAQHAISFMEKCQQDQKPFFINLWIHEPHTPFHVLPKYQWRFRDLDEADNIYAAVLSHADDRIGELLEALDRLKLTDNTLVIFSSDNGPARAVGSTELELHFDTATGAGFGIAAAKGITGGRKAYKAALFEGGIGVPFIARWPGRIAAGQVNDHSMISAVDLLPTFCEMAGARFPEGYKPDGVSQLAALTGKSSNEARAKPLFWKMKAHWPAPTGRPYHWVSYAVAHEQWKLLASEESDHVELYDIVADPLEKNDLKDAHPEVVSALLSKLNEWKQELPDGPDPKCFSELRSSSKATSHR